MVDYFAAKKQLFYWKSLECAVINAEDVYSTELLTDLRKNNPKLNLISYGINSGDLRADNLHLSSSGISFDLLYQGMKQEIKVAVVGRFNVYNLLAVFATLLVKQVAWEKLAEIALQLKPVTGRMDALIIANKPLVVVDYAHTPDALEKALSTLQEIKHTGKLFCVFGCGGNRDRGKRPQMGRIAADLADEVIITTDNPRDEEPLQIIQDITANLTSSNYQVIVDRAEAIRAALAAVKAGDIVLVAGKGHENYQEIHGVKHHFSDFELVNEILQVN
jgi:UDP-N-acetylmuramoyl-L-alanyl-D-glutamate--2,6-diaminopimelate ligase